MPAPTYVREKPVTLRSSSIGAFECPMRFKLQYREGIVPAEDGTPQRMGTNWHKMQEVYAQELDAVDDSEPEFVPDVEQELNIALGAVINHLNSTYKNIPQNVDPTDWAVERETLLALFLGYLRVWENEPVTITDTEFHFKHRLDGVEIEGTIDALGNYKGQRVVVERKTTSSNLDDFEYWAKLSVNDQVSMYALWHRETQGAQLPTLYDVVRKPTIGPANLTQTDTAAFIMGKRYFGQEFSVERPMAPAGVLAYTVDGTGAEITEGKRGFAIRETPAMFGARLLNDCLTRPEHYYQRRVIPRLDKDLVRFKERIVKIAKAVNAYDKGNLWWENWRACKNPFPCPYISICHNEGAGVYLESGQTPDGFTRLTIGGK